MPPSPAVTQMTQTASSAAMSGAAAPSLAAVANERWRPRGGEGGSSSNEWELTPVSLLLRTLGYVNNETLLIHSVSGVYIDPRSYLERAGNGK